MQQSSNECSLRTELSGCDTMGICGKDDPTASKYSRKLAADCSFVFRASPIVVDPKVKTNARCSLAKCRYFNGRNSALLFEDDVVFLENRIKKHSNSTTYMDAKRSAYPPRKVERGNFVESDWLSEVQNRSRNICGKVSVKDAATYTDRLLEREAIEAYFEEHPILDFVGTCSGMITLVGFLWYTFHWYVWLLEFAQI